MASCVAVAWRTSVVIDSVGSELLKAASVMASASNHSLDGVIDATVEGVTAELRNADGVSLLAAAPTHESVSSLVLTALLSSQVTVLLDHPSHHRSFSTRSARPHRGKVSTKWF